MRSDPSAMEMELDFRALVEDSVIGIYLVQGERFLYVNAALAAMFGYSQQEVVQHKRVGDLVAEEDRARVLENIRRRMQGEVESLHYRFLGQRRDGTVLEVEVHGRRTDTERGPAVLGTLLDLTERRRERERQEFLARAAEVMDNSLDYETTLESLARLMLPVLADYCLIDVVDGSRAQRMATAHVNPQRQRLLRPEVVRSLEPTEGEEPALRVLRTGRPVLIPELTEEGRARLLGDARGEAALAELRPRSLMVVPLIARGHILGALTLVAAESERRYQRADLAFAEELARQAALAVDNARLYRDAQEAVAAREEVLAVVSHDLRNPLNVITMCVQLLMDQDRRRNPSLEQIQRAARQMERLIQDLLDASAMKRGRLSVSPEPVAVEPLVDSVLSLVEPRAQEAGIRLEAELEEGLPPALADGDRIRQVLWNLVGNALKFTPAGGRVVVTVRQREEGLHFAVRDTGPGIPPERLEEVFGRFVQLQRGDQRGVGLGLAIVQGIVESHHGRIWVESQVGQGTTFHFVLPRAAEPAAYPAG